MVDSKGKKSADEDLDDLFEDALSKPTVKKQQPPASAPEDEENDWDKPGQKVSQDDLLQADTNKPLTAVSKKSGLQPPKSAQNIEEDPEDLFTGMLAKPTPNVIVFFGSHFD